MSFNATKLAAKVSELDPVAGGQISIIRLGIESGPSGGKPSNKARGALLARLEQLVDTGGRYCFSLVTTGVTSSTSWSKADVDQLLFWLDHGGEEHVHGIVMAVVQVLDQHGLTTDDVEEATAEAMLEKGQQRMDALLEKERKERQTMGVPIEALVNTVTKGTRQSWGYRGREDVLEALELPLDATEWPSDAAEALALLEANAPGGGAVAEQAPQEPAGPPEDEVEVEKEPDDAELLARYREEISSMAEAPVFAWTTIQRWQGGPVWSIGFRAGLSPDTMSFAARMMVKQIADFDRWVHKKGYAAVIDGRDTAAWPMKQPEPKPAPRAAAPAPTPAPASAPGTTPAPPTPPQAPSPPGASTSGGDNGKMESGTGILHKVTVDAEGVVAFHVGRFKWPLKEPRGAEAAIKAFDPDLGWTEAHLAPGAKYEGQDVAGLMVDWQKPGKYRDVVRVYRSSR